MDHQKIIIQKNTSKQLRLLLVGCVFMVGFYYLITHNIEGSRRYSPGFIKVIAYIGLFMSVLGESLLIKDLLIRKPALIIDESGIFNNSHFGSGYLVTWQNVKRMQIENFNKQRFIKIELENNDEIYRQVNYLKRGLLKLNFKFYHSPAFITSVMLGEDLEEVLKIIQERKTHFKKASQIEVQK